MFGATSIGHQLYVDDGTPPAWASLAYPKDPWSTPGTTKRYQWLRNGVVIPGATSTMYSIDAADVGKKLSYRVTGSALGYTSVTRTSESSPVVSSKTPTPRLAYDQLTVDRYLEAFLDEPWITPVPVTMKYQWLRDGAAITGATTTRYKLTAQDINKSIVLRTQGMNAGTPVETIYTAPVRPSTIAEMLAPSSMLPSFTTNPEVGSVIALRFPVGWKDPLGRWSGPSAGEETVKTTYQWLRNGARISGATKASYRPVAADAGKRLTLAITGSFTDRATTTYETGTWLPRVMPGPPPAAAAMITGTATAGSVLTAKKGIWRAPTPPEVRFQWRRNGVDITGATTANYLIKASDKGATITVRSTGIVPESPRTRGSIVSGSVTIP